MANLGSFAGGVASGYEIGTRTNIAKAAQASSEQDRIANQGFRERQLAIAEEDQAAQRADRERAATLRKEMEALQGKYYGEQDVQTGTTDQADGAGNLSQVPVMKRQKFMPGQDSLRDANFFIDSMALRLKHGSTDPKQLIEAADYARKMKETDLGRNIMGALGGNKEAMAKLAAEQGFDAATAKVEVNPEKGVFQLVTNKGTMDLKEIAMYLGADKAHAAMVGQTTDARGTKTFNLGVQKTEGQIAQDTAETALLPKKGKLLDAQANEANAKAAHAGEARKSIIDDKRQKQLDARITATMGKQVDAFADDGKSEWMAPKQWVQARVTGALAENPKADHNRLLADALKDYSAIKSHVDKQFAAASSDKAKLAALQAKYGTKQAARIKQRMFEDNLERN